MRVVGFGILGFVTGAIAGLLLTVLGLVLWYDVLQIGDHGGDGMSGLAAFLALAPLLALAGGGGGALWFIMRAHTTSKGIPIVVPIVLVLAGAYFVLSQMVI